MAAKARAFIAVTVNPNPLPTPQDGTVCIDQNSTVTNTYTLDAGLTGNYSYEWFTVNGTSNTPIAGANQSYLRGQCCRRVWR
jgi:hypothetical protein